MGTNDQYSYILLFCSEIGKHFLLEMFNIDLARVLRKDSLGSPQNAALGFLINNVKTTLH